MDAKSIGIVESRPVWSDQVVGILAAASTLIILLIPFSFVWPVNFYFLGGKSEGVQALVVLAETLLLGLFPAYLAVRNFTRNRRWRIASVTVVAACLSYPLAYFVSRVWYEILVHPGLD